MMYKYSFLESTMDDCSCEVWVKDVFQHCARDSDREALMKDFDCVQRIF